MSHFLWHRIDRSHYALVTQKLCVHMMTLTHPTDLSLHIWVKVSCCSLICSDDAIHVILHLADIHGFPPKTGHLRSTDKSSGINAVLTKCSIWSLWHWVHLITTVKLNSFSRRKNELTAPTSLCTHPAPTQHHVRGATLEKKGFQRESAKCSWAWGQP